MDAQTFSPGNRRRARPSVRNLVWSVLVTLGAILLANVFFFGYLFPPLAGMAVVSALIATLRMVGLQRGMPPPYGRGRVSVMDSKAVARGGILIVIGTIAGTILLLGTVFFLPPLEFFILLFSVAGGLPLSQVVYFSVIQAMERTRNGRIFIVLQESEEAGSPVLLRSVELLAGKSREPKERVA